MQILDCFVSAGEAFNQLKDGAFLTVLTKDKKLNVMTIGWATMGILCRVPVLMVAIRPNRYTYTLLENAEDFTVTFPTTDMSKELIYCGTISGRTINKFEGCRLTTEPGQNTKTPIIKTPGRIYECKIINSTMLDSKTMDQEIVQEYYEDSSYHKMYFGKLLASYNK